MSPVIREETTTTITTSDDMTQIKSTSITTEVVPAESVNSFSVPKAGANGVHEVQ